MMTIKKEDIDYSDIPPIKIPKGMSIPRWGDRMQEKSKRNLENLNRILREHAEMKAYFEEHGIDINSLPSKNGN